MRERCKLDYFWKPRLNRLHRKDEPACAGAEHLHMFALPLVHERGELFELWHRHVLGEKGDDVLDTALMRREHLKRIADKEQIALDDPISR